METVKIIIAKIIAQTHPIQLQSAVYEHVRSAVTPFLVRSLHGIIVLAKIQITTLHSSVHKRSFFFFFFARLTWR